MKKFFEEFFAVPEKEKVREKVIQARLTMTIGVIVFCLLVMSLTAYAYFTSDVSSGSNAIKTANFETKLQVQLLDSYGNVVEEPKPITSNYKSFKLTGLRPGEWYTVTVEPTDRSTAATGFMALTAAGCKATYHTQQLGADANVPGEFTPQLCFRVMITEKTDVVITAEWGTSSYYPDSQEKNEELYIENGEEVKLTVNALLKPTEPTQAPTVAPTEEPTETTVAPTKATEASTEATEAPTETTVAPTKATVAPAETTVAPTKATEAPTETTAAPTKATEAPTETTAAPTKATEAPTETTVAPTKATEAPTETTAAPTKATEAPTETTVAPTKETQAPTETTEAPTETTVAPTEETEPSTEATEAPNGDEG